MVGSTPLWFRPPLAQGGAFAYTGRGDYGLTFDLEKFGGLPKGTLVVRTQQWWGTYANVNLNSGSITLPVFPTLTPTAPNDPGTLFMTDFMFTQPLSKNFVVFAGKKSLAAADDDGGIGGGSGFNRFMNLAVVGNPSLLLAMPYSSFMVGMVSPQEWGSLSIWAMDAKDRTTDVFALGDLFADGVIIRPQVKFRTNFFELPGEQRFGGFYKRLDQTDLRFNQPPPGSYPYPTVPGFPTRRDAYTLDYSFEQYLQLYSEETKRGWGVFGRASVSDGNPTPYDYYLCLGLGGYSPFRHARGDQYGVGVYYTGISDQFGPLPRAIFGPRPGWGLEVFYNAQVTPWLSLTPDLQIVKPEAGAIANTSYIGGIRLNLKF